MEYRIAEPEWMIAALVAVPIALLALRWFSGMSVVRRWSAALLRVVLVTLLCLVLAGAAGVRKADKFAVVAVVDVSASVTSLADRGPTGDRLTDETGRAMPVIEQVRAFLDRATAERGPDDFVGVVLVGGQAAAVLSPTRRRELEWSSDVPLGDGTNLEAGLRLARALLPPDAAGRIVVFSDGVSTTGDAVSAARLASSGRAGAPGRGVVPVDVVPIEYRVDREAYVSSVDSPPRAAAGSTVSVRVVLHSTGESRGVLRLLDDGKPLDINGAEAGDGRALTLSAGDNVEVVDVPLDQSRIHRFRAVWEPSRAAAPEAVASGQPASQTQSFEGDTLIENNSGEAFTLTPGKGSVLLVDGVTGGRDDGSTLARALRENGLSVVVSAPDGLPTDLLELQRYDLVILENIPADAVSTAVQELLTVHVRDLGGGLVMVGGRESFGAGGWKGSRLEPMLPVVLDLPDRVVAPELAIIFVMDNSGSMSHSSAGSIRNKQQIANEAAALALRSLDKRDLVGVITFNERYDVRVPLAPHTDPEATARSVLAIGSGGGTVIGPATREAGAQLAKVAAKTRHVIVMTDGIAQDKDDLVPIARELRAQGITISTIAVGASADSASLSAMSEAGGGKHYNAINPNVLPRVFLRAVRVVRSPMIREGPFVPRVSASASPLLAGVPLSSMPPLRGLVLTQPKLDPLVTTAMITAEGEPVLAHWGVGLGQVAAFTSDASEWASSWLDWPGYGRFWAAAARTLSRPSLTQGFDGRADIADGRLTIRLEARTPNPDGSVGAPLDGLTVPATLYGPDGRGRDIMLDQVGPGQYEASTPANDTGTYVALIKPVSGATRLPPVIAGASVSGGAEYRRLTSDRPALERLAAESGGRVLSIARPEDADVFDRGGVTPLEVLTPIWRELLVWALVVLLLDIGTRRVAWDRWTSDEFAAGAGVGAGVGAGRGGAAAETLSALRAGRGATTPAAYTPVVQSEEERRRLAYAALDRERRRAVAPSAEAPAANTDISSEPSRGDKAGRSPASEGDAGLLAAKRRARERFDR